MAGYSLHIGLNLVHPDYYDGWDGALNACELDAESMALLAQEANFENQGMLLTEQATRDNVLDAIRLAAKKCSAGDIFLITYSGHGGQVPDFREQGDGGSDETWCLYDGQLLDDELVLAWQDFAKGVRILIISDSCHSGGIEKFALPGGGIDPGITSGLQVRQAPARALQRTYFTNRDFYDGLQKEIEKRRAGRSDREIQNATEASVTLFAACLDHQYSYEKPFGGMFTSSLISIWNFGQFTGTYDDMRARITPQLYSDQTPIIKTFGAPMKGWPDQQAFSI